MDVPSCLAASETIAASLRGRLGSDLDRFNFTAIPRGGLLVLGTLSYILGLDRSQIGQHGHPRPLVIVDDCSLTGARFGRFLATVEADEVIFAPLFSPAPLRAAIERAEPRVVACVSGGDIAELDAPSPDEHARREALWRTRLAGPRYWIGTPAPVCFPWSEPERAVWNPARSAVEPGWRLVPPELCLGNRLPAGRAPLPVQIQPSGVGPLRPSERALFADLDGVVLLGDVASGSVLRLEGSAASTWRALLRHGTVAGASRALAGEFAAPPERLEAGTAVFVADLVDRGLLEDTHDRARTD